MVSAIDTQNIGSNMTVEMWDHDPGATGAVVVTPDTSTTTRWVDMAHYGTFAVGAMTTVLGGNGITLLEIVARGSSAGTARQVKTSGTLAADAMGDWAFEECTAAEILAELIANSDTITDVEVAGRITCHHAGDEAVVVYIRAEPTIAKQDLTADATVA